MRLVTFESAREGPRVGRLMDGQIVDLGHEDMCDFLARPGWRERARSARAEEGIPATEVKLMAPVTRPSKFLGIGLNYSDRAAESGIAVPRQPVLFAKYANSTPARMIRLRIPEKT